MRPSHSRPHVSNDNPFSEAQFKTLKYRPEFPGRLGSFEHGLSFGRGFFHWYNYEHHHSGLALLTPAVVHYGHAVRVLEQRRQVLAAAYTAHPHRFVHGPPKPAVLPPAVCINPPPPKTTLQVALGATIVTPPDLQHPPLINTYGDSVDPPLIGAMEVAH